MPRPVRYNATLLERVDLTPTLAIFRVQPDKPAREAPWFLAGQYITLGLNNEEKPELAPVRRPLSLASSPGDLETVELYIRYVSNPASENPLTHLLWKLKAGDRLFARPAASGDFCIEKTTGAEDPRQRIFIGAGTGLAPFISMLRDKIHCQGSSDLSNYAVLHGARHESDLGYRSELESMVQTHGITYIPALSQGEQSWQGHRGRVESLFDDQHRSATQERLGLEASSSVVWICGLMGTIGRCIEGLLPLGFVPAHARLREALGIDPEAPASLYYEQYDPDPPFDLKDPQVIQGLRARLPK